MDDLCSKLKLGLFAARCQNKRDVYGPVISVSVSGSRGAADFPCLTEFPFNAVSNGLNGDVVSSILSLQGTV